ncbi:energy transducer TonB [Allosphingosinicella sp.]|uniref:energy transducer TonB n=1 Tax=Allosphingosinicella sp. TaxID=2823234 RepID=UPI002F1A8849
MARLGLFGAFGAAVLLAVCSAAAHSGALAATAEQGVVTPPRFLSGPPSDYPASARDSGHHGEVVIAGTLGIDGRIRDAAVAVSSGSPILDGASLDAARGALFTPALGEAGMPVEASVRMPFSFARYRSEVPGGGLVHYRCAAFAQDMRWWRATFPHRPWDQHELYQMILGLPFLMRGVDLSSAHTRLAAHVADFERRWEQALVRCSTSPTKRLAEVLQPEGRMMDRLSRRIREATASDR